VRVYKGKQKMSDSSMRLRSSRRVVYKGKNCYKKRHRSKNKKKELTWYVYVFDSAI